MARNSLSDLFNLSIQRPKGLTPFFYKMNFINSKKAKAIRELRVVQDILLELLRESYLRACKYVSIASSCNFKLHIFLIVLSIQNNGLSSWKFVD